MDPKFTALELEMFNRITELEQWYGRAMRDIADLNEQIVERDRALARIRKSADNMIATGAVAHILVGQQIINTLEGK
jgi:uncharacterized coiled-coil protein SlyX